MTKRIGILFVLSGLASFLISLNSFDIYTLAFLLVLGIILFFIGFYKIVRDRGETGTIQNHTEVVKNDN